MNDTLPKVIVVGDQRFADILASTGAAWQILPAVGNVNAMWDAIDVGMLPSDAAILIATDGTSVVADELESTLAAFAPYARTFVVALTARGPVVAARAQELASQVENGDPSAPVHPLPAEDLNATLGILRAQTEGLVDWSASAVAPVSSTVVPAAPAAPAPTPAVSVSPVTPAAGYEQASVYDSRVAELASAQIVKLPNARPGQVTIACMSSKGGSGKSTTAICLAGMIARSSAAAGNPKKVVLVDLDTRDGQVGSLIGQYMPTAVSIRLLRQWNAETVQANLVHDKRLGIDALLAPVRPRNADDVGPDFYKTIIQILQTTHDVVILDCSVNYLDPLLGVGFSLADEILFVTTLATTSVQGMARSLTELFADPEEGGLGIPREKVGIVANAVINNVGMGKDKLLRAALGAPLLGQIPAEHDEVLIQTNSNRMDNLLKHPRLGPAYFNLARTCLPGAQLAPLTTEAAQVDQADKKRGLFRG